MRMMAVLAGLATLSAAPALAEPAASDVTAMRHRLASSPDDQAVMAGLARAYLKAGQTSKAHRLYRQILAMEDVALDRVGGAPVRSHWLAAQVLKNAGRPRDVQMSALRR